MSFCTTSRRLGAKAFDHLESGDCPTFAVSESVSRTGLEARSQETLLRKPEIAGESDPKHINMSYAERSEPHDANAHALLHSAYKRILKGGKNHAHAPGNGGVSASSQLTLQVDHVVKAGQCLGEDRYWGSLS